MPRKHWAGLLPNDLHKTLDSLRFTDEGTSELCNRLILGLIDWIKRDRIAAVSQGVLCISLHHVRHPEVLHDYLRPALNHSIGAPATDFEVGNDLREFCYSHPRIVVTGKLPLNRKFLQFKAVPEVDDFLQKLDLALPDTKTIRIEVALRWATQAPRNGEWNEPGQFFDWIFQTYALGEVSQPECLASAPPMASRKTLGSFLKALEESGKIKAGWLGGVRSLKVSPARATVSAYELRDALASRRGESKVSTALNDGQIQVRLRSETIGFLVSDEVGQRFEGETHSTINIPKLSQPEFFKEFRLMTRALRDGTLDSVRIKTRWDYSLVIVSFESFQSQWKSDMERSLPTPDSTVKI